MLQLARAYPFGGIEHTDLAREHLQLVVQGLRLGILGEVPCSRPGSPVFAIAQWLPRSRRSGGHVVKESSVGVSGDRGNRERRTGDVAAEALSSGRDSDLPCNA